MRRYRSTEAYTLPSEKWVGFPIKVAYTVAHPLSESPTRPVTVAWEQRVDPIDKLLFSKCGIYNHAIFVSMLWKNTHALNLGILNNALKELQTTSQGRTFRSCEILLFILLDRLAKCLLRYANGCQRWMIKKIPGVRGLQVTPSTNF